MTAPVIRPWQWQDHPTRWAPGDQFIRGGVLWRRNGAYWWSERGGSQDYATDVHVDEWIMCGTAVPLVEHGNPIAGRP